MNRVFCISTLLLSLIVSCNKKQFQSNGYETVSNASLFSKFKLLSTPRDNISIGSEWTQGLGPSNSGMSEKELFESQSLSKYIFNDNNDFNLTLKLNILSALGLTVNLKTIKQYNLTIDSASIIRVKNLDNLNYSAGGTYVWEGIKIKSLSLLISKENIESITFNLKKITNNFDVSVEQGFNSLRKLEIRGLNLYTAYRLARFSSVNTNNYSDIYEKLEDASLMVGGYRTPTTLISSFKINNSYTARFYEEKEYLKNNYISDSAYYEEQKLKTIWPNFNYGDCRTVLVIQCNNEYIDRKPKEIKFRLNYGIPNYYKPESIKILLSSKVIDNTFTSEQLEMSNIHFWAGNDFFSPYVANGGIFYTHNINTIKINNYFDNTVPGW